MERKWISSILRTSRNLVDGTTQQEKIQFWSGNQNIMRKTEIGLIDGFLIYPEVSQLVCAHSYADAFGLISAFPFLLEKFTFTGHVTDYGVLCERWDRFDIPAGSGATNNFTFYVDATTRNPVAYTYKGSSGNVLGFLDSPNYDWFEIIYTKYEPGFFNQSVFDLPELCDWTRVKSLPKQVTSRRNSGFNVTLFNLKRDQKVANKEAQFYKPLSADMSALPKSVDWRTHGVVSALKDQGDCGSCWSFGAAAAVESAHAIKHKTLVPLSEQFLMDCSWSQGNNACFGGDHSSAYDYVMAQGGSWPTEAEYPYKMNQQFCQNVSTSSPVVLKTFQYVIGTHSLMDALANHGPVAVAISTVPFAPFNFYHSGVFQNSLCNPLIPDHIVLCVGYGTDENGVDYWILKNQWSKYWGEDGYMRISRAWDDCGVATRGVLPIVA